MTETFDNIYDPNNHSINSETKPLDQIIFTAIETMLKETHTWLPAKVVSITPGVSQVSIQPLLKRTYKFGKNAGKPVDLPVIPNVPIIMPRSETYWISLPVQVDDTGIALFCERSLDAWKLTGGSVDPNDTRMHNLTDAVFIPGLYPFIPPGPTPPISATPLTDLVLHNGAAEMCIQEAGTFKLQNETSAELFMLMNQLITSLVQLNTQLSTAVTATILGPQPLSAVPNFISNIATLTTLQAQFATLIGV